MRLEIAEQIDRLESCPILTGAARRSDNTVKRIQIGSADLCNRIVVLTGERQVELRLRESCAASKRRIRTELRQHQLFDRVIEQPPTGANTRLAGVSRTPGNADARRKSFVISLGHTGRNSSIARDDQSDRVLRCAIRVGTAARVDRRRLSRTERLDMLGYIRQGGVQLPTQPIIQSQIWPQLPAVLRVQVKSGIAHRFTLCRTLSVGVGEAQHVIAEKIAGPQVVRPSPVIVKLPVHVEIIELVKLLATNIHAKLHRVIARNLSQAVCPLE